MRDLAILGRLEAKRLRSKLNYWLKVLGMDPEDSRFYRIYVGLFWLYWVFFMWSYGTENVYQISRRLPSDATGSIAQFIPIVIFIGQILYLFSVFRNQPVRLNGADIAYLAISPIHRGYLVFINLLLNTWLPTLFIAVVSCFVGMLIVWQTMPDTVGLAGLFAAITMASLVFITATLAWSISMFRLRPNGATFRLASWVIFPILIIIAVVLPQITFFPGFVWVSAVMEGLTLLIGVLLVALSTLGILLLVFTGRRVDMSVIVEENQMYARIARLGPYASYYARDLIVRIHKQHRLMKRRRVRFALMTSRNNFITLMSQSVLMSLRESSFSFIMLILQGFMVTSIVGTVVSAAGLDKIQTWALIVLGLMMSRRPDIASTFRSAMQTPWLRQFLPSNVPMVLAAYSVYSFGLIYLGSLIAIAVAFPSYILTGATFSLFIGITLTIWQAFTVVPEKHIFKRELQYEASVLVSGIPIVAVGFFSQSLPMTMMTTAFIMVIAGYLLFQSYPFSS